MAQDVCERYVTPATRERTRAMKAHRRGGRLSSAPWPILASCAIRAKVSRWRQPAVTHATREALRASG
eukprot:2633381-Pleurochrysis_carterae.AAC.2